MEEWKDKNVQRVAESLRERMERGYKKYGTTTERTDLNLMDWLQHLQEELLDAAVYVERLKQEVELAKIDTSDDLLGIKGYAAQPITDLGLDFSDNIVIDLSDINVQAALDLEVNHESNTSFTITP